MILPTNPILPSLTHVKSLWIVAVLLSFLAAGSALIWLDGSDWGYETTGRGPVSGDFTWHTQALIQEVRRPMIVAELIVAAFAVVHAVKRVRPVTLWVIVAIGTLVHLSFYYYWCHPIDSVILAWNPNVPPYESGIAGEYWVRRSLDLKLLLVGVAFAAFTVARSIILRRREQRRA